MKLADACPARMVREVLTDENVPNLVAELLRKAGIEVLTVHECGLQGRPDEEVPAYAGRESRCVITSNAKDFDRISREFEQAALPHAGVICVPRSITNNMAPRVVQGLIQLHRRYPYGMWPYFLDYLSRSRNS